MNATLEGLRMIMFFSPFLASSGALVDWDGPWTDELLSAFPDGLQDDPVVSGLLFWEGVCELKDVEIQTREGAPVEKGVAAVFRGAWRRLVAEEHRAIQENRFPLRGHAFPPLDAQEHPGAPSGAPLATHRAVGDQELN